MAKKKRTVRIDGNKNADWIKSLLGHKGEITIHNALAKKFERKRKSPSPK